MDGAHWSVQVGLFLPSEIAGTSPGALNSWLTFSLPTAYSWGFRGGRERECSLRFLFEDYALDTDRRELQRAREEVVVTPQVFDLIEYLAAANR